MLDIIVKFDDDQEAVIFGDVKSLLSYMNDYNIKTVLLSQVKYCTAPALDHGYLFDLSDVERWTKFGLYFFLSFEDSLESALETIRDSIEFVLNRDFEHLEEMEINCKEENVYRRSVSDLEEDEKSSPFWLEEMELDLTNDSLYEYEDPYMWPCCLA